MLPRRLLLLLAPAALVLVGATGCAPAPPAPAPAVARTTPPPWDAPRDAVTAIAAAGLAAQPLDYRPASRGTLHLTVSYGGRTVPVPARIGEDRLRALTAGLHTHDESATVYLEPPPGPEADRPYTLGQLFTLWEVRLSERCLAGRCDGVRVTVDGAAVTGPAPEVPLLAGTEVRVEG
ncbi:MAG TPA: hypothetical protein VFN19_08695 [Candidatus Nanopelagicales bacterium]|nr:hypothetical protein [Candidatus Nanopelagicales bacterium]